MQCFLVGKPCEKKPQDFGVQKPSELLHKIFMDGVWTRCDECKAALPSRGDPSSYVLAEAARRDDAKAVA